MHTVLGIIGLKMSNLALKPVSDESFCLRTVQSGDLPKDQNPNPNLLHHFLIPANGPVALVTERGCVCVVWAS